MTLLDFWDTNRPSVKRRKLTPEVSTPQIKTEPEGAGTSEHSVPDEVLDVKLENSIPPTSADEGPLNDDEGAVPSSQTDLEFSLPAVEANDQAIEEYESSQKVEDGGEEEISLEERMRDGKWRKGKSSIYVDAFNLALDTVLAEEAHLFSETEKEVFRHWRRLSYESQYLFVLIVVLFIFPLTRWLTGF